MRLAALFLLLYATILTLSPAVRYHSWQVTLRWTHWFGFIAWVLLFLIADRASRKLLPERDPFLLPVAAFLSGWGLMTIWRISDGFGARQSAWLAVCIAVFIAGLRVPNVLPFLRRYKYLWLTGGLLLTGLTFFFGTYPGGPGPRLWLGCCGVYFQPSEPLKLLLIVYLSSYLADHMLAQFSLMQLLTPTLAVTGVAAVLLIAQRDLGTTSLLIFIYAAILFTALGLKRVVAVSLGMISLASVAAYFSFDVVRLRVDAWINPWVDPTGRSYQIVQSLLGVAAGGLGGQGPGLGNPGVVPVAISDFIFSAISEEAGLVGSIAIILLVAILMVRGLRVAFCAPDLYQRSLAAGLTIYLAAQSLLIMGGNLRLFPLTGITLPFVSYGGSSLLTSYLSLLLLLQISNQPEDEPAALPNTRPYLVLGSLLMIGLVAAALLDGWWAVYRSDALLARYDNPRRSINDRFVKRGSLLDRNDLAISSTSGSPGSYTRLLNYPPLSPITGYTDPIYGLAGLEASLDAYLRGMQGYPASTLWWSQTLYSQPPPGLDVRLTIDLNMQRIADEALGTNAGAAVLINARSGEILAMASHPYFDPARLSDDWAKISQDPGAPLLDRAAQGQYPPGTVLGPFFMAARISRGEPLPELADGVDYLSKEGIVRCSGLLAANPTFAAAVSAGCPNPLVNLAQALGASETLALFNRLGFYQAPGIPLPVASQPIPPAIDPLEQAAIGRGGVQISPLQMALAAATISSDGMLPQPRLTIAVQSPAQGWSVLPADGAPRRVFVTGTSDRVAALLARTDAPLWQALGGAPNGSNKWVSWFIGGTLPEWQGTPLAVAIVVEQDNSRLAATVGDQLLRTATGNTKTP